MKEEICEGNYQPIEEEQDFSHDSVECNEIKEVNYEDETLVNTPPSDEALQDPIPPVQNKENEVSCFPFQIFEDTLFYDSNNK